MELLQSLVPWLKGLPYNGVMGVAEKLITHLLLVDGVAGTGTVVVEVPVVDVGAVGVVGALGAVVALLVPLFSCVLILWGFPLKYVWLLKVPKLKL